MDRGGVYLYVIKDESENYCHNPRKVVIILPLWGPMAVDLSGIYGGGSADPRVTGWQCFHESCEDFGPSRLSCDGAPSTTVDFRAEVGAGGTALGVNGSDNLHRPWLR